MPHAPKERPEGRWKVDAACSGVGISLFFPDESAFVVADEDGNPGKFCFNCPVRQECLNDAVNSREYDGVWGGVNEADRRVLITALILEERAIAKAAREERKKLQ